ncbi:MAG: hypothetical protein WA947_02295 [Phormidesmis sp.]
MPFTYFPQRGGPERGLSLRFELSFTACGLITAAIAESRDLYLIGN